MGSLRLPPQRLQLTTHPNIRLPFQHVTNSGLRVTARRLSDPHPRNQHIEVVVRLDWPTYAVTANMTIVGLTETHFLSLSAATEMIQQLFMSSRVAWRRSMTAAS